MSASLALQGQLPMAPCHLLCQLLGQGACAISTQWLELEFLKKMMGELPS